MEIVKARQTSVAVITAYMCLADALSAYIVVYTASNAARTRLAVRITGVTWGALLALTSTITFTTYAVPSVNAEMFVGVVLNT